jgi:hypothetical protein
MLYNTPTLIFSGAAKRVLVEKMKTTLKMKTKKPKFFIIFIISDLLSKLRKLRPDTLENYPHVDWSFSKVIRCSAIHFNTI